MFKLRRRTVAATAASDLPFCTMCGTTIRVDAASGRCALGHRVAVVDVAPVEAVATDETAVLEPVAAYEVTTAFEAASFETPEYDSPVYDSPVTYADEQAGGIAGEGLYEAYQSADAAGRTVTWEDVVAPPAAEGGGVYDDYLSWDEPVSGFSSLDVDTDELPVAEVVEAEVEDAPEAPAYNPLPADLLDELDDDAAHARRRAAGTIGATVGFSALAFASIAVLPF